MFPQNTEVKPLDFIGLTRMSVPNALGVFTMGNCFHFHLSLKAFYPDAEAYDCEGHVVTKIDGKLYDITGEVDPKSGNYIPIDREIEKRYMERIIRELSQQLCYRLP